MIGQYRDIYSQYPEAECESGWDGSSSHNRIIPVWKTGILKFQTNTKFLDQSSESKVRIKDHWTESVNLCPYFVRGREPDRRTTFSRNPSFIGIHFKIMEKITGTFTGFSVFDADKNIFPKNFIFFRFSQMLTWLQVDLKLHLALWLLR